MPPSLFILTDIHPIWIAYRRILSTSLTLEVKKRQDYYEELYEDIWYNIERYNRQEERIWS